MPVVLDHPVCRAPGDVDARLWRYVDFTKFVWLLERKALYVPRADQLGDPFEGSITAQDYARRPEWVKEAGFVPGTAKSLEQWYRTQPSLYYISCWHMNEGESAAMWRLYLKSDEGIAIQTSYDRLRVALDACDRDIFMGLVSYIDYEDHTIPDSNMMWPFFHKRQSYEHERELRALVPDLERLTTTFDYEHVPEGPLGIDVPLDVATLVERIYVAPSSPAWIRELTQAVVARYGLDVPVIQSRMTTDPLF